MITIITSIIAMVFIKKKNPKSAFKALLAGLILDAVIFIGGILTSFILIVAYSGTPNVIEHPTQQVQECKTQTNYNPATQKFEKTHCNE